MRQDLKERCQAALQIIADKSARMAEYTAAQADADAEDEAHTQMLEQAAQQMPDAPGSES